MDDTRIIKIGDIIPMYTKRNVFMYNKFITTHYGIVIGFTKTNNNPRITYLHYEKDPNLFNFGKVSIRGGKKISLIKYLKKTSCICVFAFPIDKEMFLQDKARRKNYDKILKLLANEEINNKALQLRKKEKIDFGL